MRFMLYTVCKTLRLSVFNKELFDKFFRTTSLFTGRVSAGRKPFLPCRTFKPVLTGLNRQKLNLNRCKPKSSKFNILCLHRINYWTAM